MITVLLSLAFLFFVGSCIGWCIEVLFRRFCSAKKWINPGFLAGPYLPLYGFGLVGLYLLCLIPLNTGYAWLNALLMVVIMGVTMTAIEYVAGLIFICGMKIKLWDYSDRRGNIQGIICPLFSFFWTVVGAVYYFVIDPFVIDWVEWFTANIAFAFVVGVFFGVFAIDFAHSVNLSVRIRTFAKERGIVVAFERLKESVRENIEKVKAEVGDSVRLKKQSFLFAFRSHRTIEDELKDYDKKRRGEEENS